MMLFYNSLGQSQTYSCTSFHYQAVVRLIEAVENALQVFFRDANAAIRNSNYYVLIELFNRYINPTMLVSKLKGIRQYIIEHLFKLNSVEPTSYLIKISRKLIINLFSFRIIGK